MTKLTSILFLLTFSFTAFAQYEEDVLRLGRSNVEGSARIQAIGGAVTALGADINSASTNPAGLGLFRSSVIALSPSVSFNNTESTYFEKFTDSYDTKFKFSNVGVVFNHKVGDIEQGSFRGGSFAISLSRINDYNSSTVYDTHDNISSKPSGEFLQQESIIHSYIARADGVVDPINLDQDLLGGYEHYLINPISDSSYFGITTGNPRQSETIQTSGGQYLFNLAYGANINDVFYIGLGIGFTRVDYRETRLLEESEFEGGIINSLSIQKTRNISGRGTRANLGIIIRPTDALRIGVSIETPTHYVLNNDSKNDLRSVYDNYSFITEDTVLVLDEMIPYSYDESVNFNLKTPLKISLGASYVIGKIGFISADVDFLDYASSRIKFNDFTASDHNQEIRKQYASSMNIRVGGEFKYEGLAFRAGYNHQGNPFQKSDLGYSIQSISAGIGFRVKHTFADLAVVNTSFKSKISPYTYDDDYDDPTADINNNNLRVAFTLGWNF